MKKYNKLYVFLVVLVLVLPISLVAQAHEGADDPADHDLGDDKGGILNRESPSRPSLGTIKAKLKDDKGEFRQKMMDDRKAFMDELKKKRDAFKEQLDKEKEEWKKANIDRKKEFWTHVGEMMGNRFKNVIEQLTNAQTRLGEVIEKLHDDGKDTDDATASLNLSKQKLSDAKAKLDAIKALLPTDGSKITPEIFTQIKTLAREAKDLLKESREALRDTFKAIKELKVEDEDNDN